MDGNFKVRKVHGIVQDVSKLFKSIIDNTL